MRKPTKILVTSLIVSVFIVIYVITGIAVAKDPPPIAYLNSVECCSAGECQSIGECTGECPDGGECLPDGSDIKIQSHTCNSVCTQKQLNNQNYQKTCD